jgi:cell division protein FtsW (lipid II flippase)
MEEESRVGGKIPSYVSLSKPLLYGGDHEDEENSSPTDFRIGHYLQAQESNKDSTTTIYDTFYLEVQSAVRWYSVPIGFSSQISQLSGLAYVSQLDAYYTQNSNAFTSVGGIEKGLYYIASFTSRVDPYMIFMVWIVSTILYLGPRDGMTYIQKAITTNRRSNLDDVSSTTTISKNDVVTLGIQFHLGYLIGLLMAWLIVIGFLFTTSSSGGDSTMNGNAILDLLPNIVIVVLGGFVVLYTMTKASDVDDEVNDA